MKTNVVMRSVDRNLFGIVIKQNTKNGQHLSVTDLMAAYESERLNQGWSDKRLNDIINSKSFIEVLYYVLYEKGVVSDSVGDFVSSCCEKGTIRFLKSVGMWSTTGRGDRREVFCDAYVWTLLATQLHPMFLACLLSVSNLKDLDLASLMKSTRSVQTNSSNKSVIKTYLFQSGEKYKIGKSWNVEKRLNHALLYNPDIKLVCYTNRNVEKRLHEKYKEFSCGREWFVFDDVVLKQVLLDFENIV